MPSCRTKRPILCATLRPSHHTCVVVLVELPPGVYGTSSSFGLGPRERPLCYYSWIQRAWVGLLPAVAVACVVCGCGGDGAAESRGVAGGNSGGAASGGAGGGAGGGAAKQCQVVDGNLQYGPIGEPRPLPIELSSVQAAPSAAMVFGLRTAEGYGFVWGTQPDPNAPNWTLYSTTVDLDFGGGNPRVLDTKDSASSFDVIPASDGYLVATCSRDSPVEWIRLDSDFEIVQEASPITLAAPCNSRQPSILWTGEYYLTYFADARGLVVASLDEQGDIVREEILSEERATVTQARFSKNGDRVLVASAGGSKGLARYGVFDLEGRLMGDVQRFGEEESFPSQLAITTSGDGWLVVSDYAVTNKQGLRLTNIPKDGLVSWEQRLWPGYPTPLGMAPSAYGGSLYVGAYYSGGAYGEDYSVIGLIDDTGSSAYYDEQGFVSAESWSLAVIRDSQRDLVVKASCLDDSYGTVFVQEYGCLE